VAGLRWTVYRFIGSVGVCLFAASHAQAQSTTEPDTTKVRVRVGPVALNPTIELTSLGVDTNVFYQPDGEQKRDFAFTLTPKTDAWMKVGPTWITGSVREDIVWYQKYSSERSGNNFYSIGWVVPLNRLGFGFEGRRLSARDRPGFEIEARSQRSELEGRGSIEYRAFAKTFLGLRGGRQRVDFDEDAVFLGTNLQFELNRTMTTGAFTIKHQLTPLTSIALDVGRQQDRFGFSPLRDSDSTTAGLQVSFDPFALIKGNARFGYRDFRPADPSLPGFRGTTAAVDLSYVLQGSTRLTLQVNRDIQYSFDVAQPYYVQTGAVGSLAQQIYGPIDAVVRAGGYGLAYRDRATGAAVAVSNRDDSVRMYGGGIGYHLGRELRIGVNVDRQRRSSDAARRSYNGLRIGTSVTYGL
jgi:hypothetical protein